MTAMSHFVNTLGITFFFNITHFKDRNAKFKSSARESKAGFLSGRIVTKGLRLDDRDQPWSAGSLPVFSYDYRYCLVVTENIIMTSHDHGHHQPLVVGPN